MVFNKMSEMIGIKIYGLKNPLTGMVFYVGATGLSLKKRLNGHMNSTDKNKEKVAVISGLKEMGVRPEIILLENVTDEKDCLAKSLELKWIKHFESLGHILTNKNKNGAGASPSKNAKVQVTLYFSESVINKHGGKEALKKLLYDYLDSVYIKGTEDGI